MNHRDQSLTQAFGALRVVVIVIAVLISGLISGRYLFSSNAASQIYTGTVLKVGMERNEVCFAYVNGSTRTSVCNQLFTSGRVSIQEGQEVTFFIVTILHGGITSHGFVVLNR
jgi:hypothetical protein